MAAMAAVDLKPPVLLMAMPHVLDPFFHKSVVLLVAHEDEGSLGFILNRPTGIRVTEILQGMEIEWHGDPSELAFFGGPVQPQLGTVLFAPPEGFDAETPVASEVHPGVRITQHVGHLAQLATLPPKRFRLFLGYAGWGAGQLVEEILRNDWLAAAVGTDLLFPLHPEELWEKALKSAGFDPAALPTWTPLGNEEETN